MIALIHSYAATVMHLDVVIDDYDYVVDYLYYKIYLLWIFLSQKPELF